MRFLCKIALLILAARVLAGTPEGSNQDLDAVGNFSLRDLAGGISAEIIYVDGGFSHVALVDPTA